MKKILALIMTLSIFVLSGCSSQTDRMVTDRERTEVHIPTKIEKIISTAPSNTELLVGLGLADKIIAADTYSEGIEGLSKDTELMDFQTPDAEKIIELNPDIIIASGYNQVGSSEDPYKSVSDAGIPVVYIPSSNSIDGIYKDISFIAELVGAKDKGDEMIASMKKEVDSIKEIGSKIKDKKKVYFEIGPAPTLYSVGKDTFINEMIQTIGAENIFANQDAWISPSEESVIDANPDVILTNVNYVENPTKEIMSRDGWDNITAVKEKAVYSIDANSSSRPTQNIIKALKEMAKAVYPDEFKDK